MERQTPLMTIRIISLQYNNILFEKRENLCTLRRAYFDLFSKITNRYENIKKQSITV